VIPFLLYGFSPPDWPLARDRWRAWVREQIKPPPESTAVIVVDRAPTGTGRWCRVGTGLPQPRKGKGHWLVLCDCGRQHEAFSTDGRPVQVWHA
jgi:hypothetical protein